ncbi:2'-deoxynucleoside 5'-phosphate N-hydrolase 1 [Mugil cephalus]|uniref:2'-deoxynucleoside 5'-phosphate N-hydrolase 1 n=1 Tax=Mugil cephalus TaxID=48193 RepID=UPI001FB72B03|nr:2'-deoxynucleoside 5'-phosphate N-hydrolase 1 [Mugil cephalus]
MKVYFCGSIRGGRDDAPLYRRIVTALQTYGSVLTEHVSSPELTDRGEDATAAGDRYIHDRDVDWIRQSDAVVAEVTQPSLGVGYELGRAVDMKKKILCLFRPSSGRGESLDPIWPTANQLCSDPTWPTDNQLCSDPIWPTANQLCSDPTWQPISCVQIQHGRQPISCVQIQHGRQRSAVQCW